MCVSHMRSPKYPRPVRVTAVRALLQFGLFANDNLALLMDYATKDAHWRYVFWWPKGTKLAPSMVTRLAYVYVCRFRYDILSIMREIPPTTMANAYFASLKADTEQNAQFAERLWDLLKYALSRLIWHLAVPKCHCARLIRGGHFLPCV